MDNAVIEYTKASLRAVITSASKTTNISLRKKSMNKPIGSAGTIGLFILFSRAFIFQFAFRPFENDILIKCQRKDSSNGYIRIFIKNVSSLWFFM